MRGLYAIKPWFVRRLRRFEDLLVARRVSPDTLTVAAVAASVGAGAAIALGGALDQPMLWLLVPPLVLVRLALNALDGSVARRTGRACPFGAMLNEIGDRMSDVATIGSTVAVVSPPLAVAAVGSSMIASTAGIVALAVRGERDASGPMGKADRAAVLALGCLAAALLDSTRPIAAAVAAIAAGSLVTGVARAARLRGALEEPSSRG